MTDMTNRQLVRFYRWLRRADDLRILRLWGEHRTLWCQGFVTVIRVAPAAAIIAAAGCGSLAAQLVVEIDPVAGRDVINDDYRAISIVNRHVAVDHDRSILYVRDAEEPNGVMAWSLVTGRWIRTYPVPTGDGPQELGDGIASLMAKTDGGLYVSGWVRVLQFDAAARFVSYWQPRAPPRRAVCDFDGEPAIPTVYARRPIRTARRSGGLR